MALTVALGSAWWSWSVSPPAPPDAPAAVLPAGLVAVELDPAWHTVGRREADIELGLRPVAGPSPAAPDIVPRLAGEGAPAVSAVESDGLGGSVAPSPGGASNIATADTSPISEAAIDALFSDTSVYSGGNAAVVPPRMLYPRMPRAAFPAPGQVVTGPYFEVLVDQQGGVEAVRLRGREQPGQTHYRAGMMLSAAKAWQFRPARLEGRPVRYVVRVVPEQ